MSVPRPPAGSGREGRRLWNDILSVLELNPAEMAVLRCAAQAAGMCEALAAEMDGKPLLVVTADGVPRVHPLVVELRLHRMAVARLLTALRIPDEPDAGRPQLRALRGVYGKPG